MNILRLSTLSLTLAIAVITLGYANSSFAGPDCDTHPTHPSCGGDGTQTTFDVAWAMGNATTPFGPVACVGTAERGLGVKFDPDACKIKLVGVTDYCVCQISVRANKKSTSFHVFVHTPCDEPHCGTDVWSTDRLPAKLEFVNGGPDFTITADPPLSAGAVLTKIHQPEKGTTLNENISVGVLEYTAVED